MTKLRCEDITGLKFNRLLVLEYSHSEKNPKSKGYFHYWKCQCDCGVMKITKDVRALKNGSTKSCGCLHLENISKLSLTHGKSKTKEYTSYMAMKRRCYEKSFEHYEYYGGRGITVCDRWVNSFENFLEDMGECPEGMTLDRIDSDLNYEPLNCKWSTKCEQSYNTRKRKDNTTGKTGVTYAKDDDIWIARISFNKERIHLGSFKTYELAVEARETAEIKYYGEIKNVTK